MSGPDVTRPGTPASVRAPRNSTHTADSADAATVRELAVELRSRGFTVVNVDGAVVVGLGGMLRILGTLADLQDFARRAGVRRD